MLTSLQVHLAGVFLKIFLRNRQAILFSLFFPLIFIGAFSFSGTSNDPFIIGVTDESQSPFSQEFITNLEQEEIFNLIEGDFESLQSSLIEGETETDAKDVCLLLFESNGEILTSLCIPISDCINPYA